MHQMGMTHILRDEFQYTKNMLAFIFKVAFPILSGYFFTKEK